MHDSNALLAARISFAACSCNFSNWLSWNWLSSFYWSTARIRLAAFACFQASHKTYASFAARISNFSTARSWCRLATFACFQASHKAYASFAARISVAASCWSWSAA